MLCVVNGVKSINIVLLQDADVLNVAEHGRNATCGVIFIQKHNAMNLYTVDFW